MNSVDANFTQEIKIATNQFSLDLLKVMNVPFNNLCIKGGKNLMKKMLVCIEMTNTFIKKCVG